MGRRPESNTTKISFSQLEWIQNIISNMNTGRTEFNYSLIPSLKDISPFWLLGFIEADGSFGFKNLSPFFSNRTTCKKLICTGSYS